VMYTTWYIIQIHEYSSSGLQYYPTLRHIKKLPRQNSSFLCAWPLSSSASMLITKTTSLFLLRAPTFRVHRILPNLIVPRATMSSSSFLPEDLKAIVQEVATLLKERNETISVAETVYCPPSPLQSHLNM
jgi:hypothetical protein